MSIADERPVALVSQILRLMAEHGATRVQVGDVIIERPLRPALEPTKQDPAPPTREESDWLAQQSLEVQDAVIKYGRWPAGSPRGRTQR